MCSHFCSNLCIVMYRKFRNVPLFNFFSLICSSFWNLKVGKYVSIRSNVACLYELECHLFILHKVHCIVIWFSSRTEFGEKTLKYQNTNIHLLEVIKLQKGVCKKIKGFPNLEIKFCYKVKCMKSQYEIDCEIQSCVILFFTGRGSKRPLSSPVREVDKPDIEVWALTDVVFVEDIRCAPIGKVLKVGFIYWNNFMSCSHVVLVSLWYFLWGLVRVPILKHTYTDIDVTSKLNEIKYNVLGDVSNREILRTMLFFLFPHFLCRPLTPLLT